MAHPIIQRESCRTPHHGPIRYAVADAKESFDSHMVNYSAGGLCYESNEPVTPEEKVCIVMKNYLPGHNGPEAYRSYVAKVRWVRELNNGGGPLYAAGAQILVRSHDLFTCVKDGVPATCDLCAIPVTQDYIVMNNKCVHLCSKCAKHMDNLPTGKIKDCIERFLLGNVV